MQRFYFYFENFGMKSYSAENGGGNGNLFSKKTFHQLDMDGGNLQLPTSSFTVTSRPTRVYGEKSHHMARFLTI